VDGSGTSTNIYVGGSFRTGFGTKVNFNTPGSNNPNLLLTPSGFSDLFVEKFDAQGNSVKVVQGGSPSPNGHEGLAESANGLALDATGNVYLAGNFTNTAHFGPFTLSGLVPDSATAVVAKLDKNLNWVWADALQSTQGINAAQAIAVRGDLVYSTGMFLVGADFDPSPKTFNLSTAGDGDAFTWVLNVSGNFVAASHQGGPGRDAGYGIAVDNAGYIDTVGSFEQTAKFGPFTLNSLGDADLYVYRQGCNSSPTHPFFLDDGLLANLFPIIDDRHWSPLVAGDLGQVLTESGTGGSPAALLSMIQPASLRADGKAPVHVASGEMHVHPAKVRLHQGHHARQRHFNDVEH
jgi:hypothetical protein